MSGFVGILNLDGAPVDRALLQHMTKYLTFCGPDQQNIWLQGSIGFGHTLLRTTFESVHEEQPFQLDGQLWIVADARVDGRDELISKLQAKGRVVTADQPDVELILHAYRIWGERCVEHLIGDFAFAIWDARRQSLFCARDHWGVKPFYYAQVGNCLVFSNVLNCVRIHPAVSDELNEQFIGDFLLFGANQEFDTTVFADIQRLSPAHYLIHSERLLSLHRYWSLPTDLPIIRYKQATDYVEHFRELLQIAVADRLRTDRVAVAMSGGLDSSSVAATALALRSNASLNFDLQAFTVVYDRLIPDRERYYSGLVAQGLNIPIHYLVADDYTLYERQEQAELCKPEPINEPQLAIGVDLLKAMADHSRVTLTGYDGDMILSESPGPYFGALLRQLRLRQATMEMKGYILSQRCLPPLGLRTWFKRMRQKSAEQFVYPVWLNKSFTQRCNLRARLDNIIAKQTQLEHPTRPKAYRIISLPSWTQLFEYYSAGATQLPLEVRHPLADLRLVLYALSVPLSPWIVNKHLLSAAMRSALPDPIRLRPKTPLVGNPLIQCLRSYEARWIDRYVPTPALTQYVDKVSIPQIAGEEDLNMVWMNLRPLSLNYWLQYVMTMIRPFNSEVDNECSVKG